MKYKWLILLILIYAVLMIHEENKPDDKYEIETYTVQAGDTAWRIAEKFNNSNRDIRELIYYMKIDNDIRPGYIYPGQEIKVRIYESRERYEYK